MGDYHVRFRERLRVKLPLSTRPRWNCTYHIVFIPKYRRKIMYGELKKDIVEIIRKLCEMKQVEVIDGRVCKDHIHMDGAPFLRGRPLPVFFGEGFSKAVQDFFALVTISIRTAPARLRALSVFKAGTVRKYRSSRRRQSPKVWAAAW